MTDLLVTAAIAVVAVLGIGAALDALGRWWEASAERRADAACTHYRRCPECGEDS